MNLGLGRGDYMVGILRVVGGGMLRGWLKL